MIRILTDSTADFSMADAAALGVAVVPLTVSFGDAHYQDGIDLPLERFYDMLAAADKLPTTSQPSPELFLSHFLAAKAAGDTVICVLLYAVVDTLKYLHKGGRLSGAVAIAGGLLGIKPVLSLDARGKLGMVDKARGMPGAYVAIFKGIDRCGGIDEAWPVTVGYTGSPKGVGPFACYVTQNLHLQKPMVQAIGTVIGTHAGPGACGIAFFANEPFPGETE